MLLTVYPCYLLCNCDACRPGDGTLPKRFVPVGTQVGTPAWVPNEVEEDSGLSEEDTGVAKHWFVHLRRTGHKASEKTHSKIDTAGHTSMRSSRASSGILAQNWPSGSSIVSAGTVGECAAVCIYSYCMASSECCDKTNVQSACCDDYAGIGTAAIVCFAHYYYIICPHHDPFQRSCCICHFIDS